VNCLRIAKNELLLDIKAAPGSSKSHVVGISAGRLRITVAAVPENGKANEELRSFLSKVFGIAKKEIVLKTGEHSRLKTVSIPAAYRNSIEKILQDLAV
jgi:uncharacterized protein (TIGR00251 family)